MKVFLYILILLMCACNIKPEKQVNTQEIIAFGESGLPMQIYKIIEENNLINIKQKNNIILAVSVAIKNNKDKQELKAAIHKAVADNNGDKNLENNLLNLLSKASILKSEADSGLVAKIYLTISEHDRASAEEKNAVIDLVREAIANAKNQANRDMLIKDAVADNGKYAGWAKSIILNVDEQYPLTILKTLEESKLPEKIYNIIKVYEHIYQSSDAIAWKNALMDAVVDAMKLPMVERDKIIWDAGSPMARAIIDALNYLN